MTNLHGFASMIHAVHQQAVRRTFNLSKIGELAGKTQEAGAPHDVVLKRHTHRLLRYRRETPATQAEPVLLCYALVNRPYILDLQPDKSVVRRYLEQGFDVYLIDWGVPSIADRQLTLEYYVCGFLKESVAFVQREHHCDKLHLLGYCMGGTLSAMFAALFPDLPKSLTLLAAPIDFSGRQCLLNLWSDRKHFDVDAFVDIHGNCPSWFLQSCFLQVKPIQSFVEKNFAFYQQLDDLRDMANYLAMERWLNDNIPVAGETFRDFVKSFYQENQLVRGEFHLGRQRINLGRIVCPLLLLTAGKDHLVAPASTEGIRPHVGSREIESMTIDAGHVGLVVGGKAQSSLWPEAARWMAAH